MRNQSRFVLLIVHDKRRCHAPPVRLDDNPFNLIEADRIAGSIVELGGSNRLMGCYALGMF